MLRWSARLAYRTLLYSIAVGLVLFAVLLTGLRYLLPQLPDVTRQIEQVVAQRYQLQLQVGTLRADWNHRGPQLVLEQVQVQVQVQQSREGEAPALLNVGEARLHINLWHSLSSWSLQFTSVTLRDAQYRFDLRRAGAGDTPELAQVQQFLLHQLDSIEVLDSRLQLVNLLGVSRDILITQLAWRNQNQQHQGRGQFRIDSIASNELDVMIDLRSGKGGALSGKLYAHAHAFDIAPWLQQRAVAAEIKEAQLNFTLWLQLADDRLVDGTLQLRDNRFRWQRGEHPHQLQLPNGLLRLQPQAAQGWLVNSTPLTLLHQQQAWQLPPLRWQFQPGQQQWSMSAIPLAPLLALLGRDPQEVQRLNQQVTGVLDLKARQRSGEPLQWQLVGENLSWPEWAGVPGLQAVNLQLDGADKFFQWHLFGRDAQLRSGMLDVDRAWPLKVDMNGHFSVSDPASDLAALWHLRIAPRSEIELQGLPLQLAAGVRRHTDGVEVRASVASRHDQPLLIDTLRQALPAVMGENLQNYLSNALIAGEAEGLAMVWRGELSNFPYPSGDGVFAAQANLKQLLFKFQPDWLPVYDADIALNFSQQRMHLVARDARLGEAQLPLVEVLLDDLKDPAASLTIRGEVATEAAALRPIFSQSPLASSVAASLRELQPRGPLRGTLELSVPVGRKQQQPLRARGTVQLRDNQLFIDSIGQPFTALTGTLSFDNDRLWADNLRLQWQQLPLRVALQSGQQAEHYQVTADITAAWDLGTLAKQPTAQQPPALKQWVEGTWRWQSQFELRLPKGGNYSFHWRQQSDLQQLALHLPEPLAKPAEAVWPLQILFSGDQDSMLLNAELADRALLEVQFDGGAEGIRQGYARIGEAISRQPSANMVRLQPRFPLELQAAEIELNDWRQSVSSIAQSWQGWLAAREDDGRTPLPQIDLVQLSTPQLTLAGYALGAADAVAWPQDDGWQFELEAAAAALQGRYQPAQGSQTAQLDLNADFISVAAPAASAGDEPAEATASTAWQLEDLQSLPKIALRCQRCRYGDYDLGQLTLQLHADEQGLQVSQLQLAKDRHRLNATGTWRLASAEGQQQTQAKGNFNSADLGNFLRDYDITSSVQDSPANIDFDLSWDGAPWAFNRATLDGSVRWRLGQGYLVDVSDGGARILSLLSLEGLLRKLRFDFRDVFANGLFYTEFAGDFALQDGVVSTHNTRMNGSAGDMEIYGSVNLNSNELNYQVFYIPKVTSSLPVILAWMVNPPSGLAALLIDRVLHDAQVISRLEYRITGTIEAPVVEEVARSSREVPLPPPSQPEQQPPPIQPPAVQPPEESVDAIDGTAIHQ